MRGVLKYWFRGVLKYSNEESAEIRRWGSDKISSWWHSMGSGFKKRRMIECLARCHLLVLAPGRSAGHSLPAVLAAVTSPGTWGTADLPKTGNWISFQQRIQFLGDSISLEYKRVVCSRVIPISRAKLTKCDQLYYLTKSKLGPREVYSEKEKLKNRNKQKGFNIATGF